MTIALDEKQYEDAVAETIRNSYLVGRGNYDHKEIDWLLRKQLVGHLYRVKLRKQPDTSMHEMD